MQLPVATAYGQGGNCKKKYREEVFVDALILSQRCDMDAVSGDCDKILTQKADGGEFLM